MYKVIWAHSFRSWGHEELGELEYASLEALKSNLSKDIIKSLKYDDIDLADQESDSFEDNIFINEIIKFEPVNEIDTAEIMTNLIKDILDYSEKERVEFQQRYKKQELENAQRIIERYAKKN